MSHCKSLFHDRDGGKLIEVEQIPLSGSAANSTPRSVLSTSSPSASVVAAVAVGDRGRHLAWPKPGNFSGRCMRSNDRPRPPLDACGWRTRASGNGSNAYGDCSPPRAISRHRCKRRAASWRRQVLFKTVPKRPGARRDNENPTARPKIAKNREASLLLRNPTWQFSGLLDPRRQLRFVQRIAFVDVDPARVLATRRSAGRHRIQRDSVEERRLHVAGEDVE